MALSDYDCIFFDADGQCIAGSFVFDNGLVIEPYKTWLYIRHKAVWGLFKDNPFIEPTIAQINNGTMVLLGVEIIVTPKTIKNSKGVPYGRTNFFYCQRGYGDKRISCGGIICQGHYNFVQYEIEKRGLAEKYPGYEWFTMSSFSGGVTERYLEGMPPIISTGGDGLKENVTIKMPNDWGEDSWHGISKDMLREFYKWEVPEAGWMAAVRKTKVSSFNQGDAFISKALDMPMPVSTPEKKSTPILHKALGMDKTGKRGKKGRS